MIEGENLDLLIGSIPMQTEDEKVKEKVKANIMNLLSKEYGIEEEDFLSAEIEVVPAGEARDYGFDRSKMCIRDRKKDRVMSDKERKIVSYHEVGHAIVTALQKNTEPVQKITIVPRTMGALGYTCLLYTSPFGSFAPISRYFFGL